MVLVLSRDSTVVGVGWRCMMYTAVHDHLYFTNNGSTKDQTNKQNKYLNTYRMSLAVKHVGLGSGPVGGPQFVLRRLRVQRNRREVFGGRRRVGLLDAGSSR